MQWCRKKRNAIAAPSAWIKSCFPRKRVFLIPNISPWSVTAIPFIPSAIALSTKRGIDAWPSRMEYCQIFFFMIFVAGDMLDTVFGLAMGKVMDPGGGVQVSVLGQFLNVFFFLYFFATGSHRLMIKLFAYSFELIPAGAAAVSMEKAGPFVLALFHSV